MLKLVHGISAEVLQLKEGRIPWGSVSIPKDPPTNKKRMTKEQLEAYVKLKALQVVQIILYGLI